MKEVMCSQCEYFVVDYIDENMQNNIIVRGECVKKHDIVSVTDKVCEEFLLAKGVYTQKIIPDYCKNRELYVTDIYGITFRKDNDNRYR